MPTIVETVAEVFLYRVQGRDYAGRIAMRLQVVAPSVQSVFDIVRRWQRSRSSHFDEVVWDRPERIGPGCRFHPETLTIGTYPTFENES